MVATRTSPANSAIPMAPVAMPNATMLAPHNSVDFLCGIA